MIGFNNSIVEVEPQIGHSLYVEGVNGQRLNAGVVSSARREVVTRGETGSQIRVPMIRVKTDLSPQGFWAYQREDYERALRGTSC